VLRVGIIISTLLVIGSFTCLKKHSMQVYVIISAGIIDLVSDVFCKPWLLYTCMSSIHYSAYWSTTQTRSIHTAFVDVTFTPWRCSNPYFRLSGTIFIVIPVFLAGFFFIYKTYLAVNGARYNAFRPSTYKSDGCTSSCFNPFVLVYCIFNVLYGILCILALPLELIVLVFCSIIGLAAELLLKYGWSQYEATFSTFLPACFRNRLSNLLVAMLSGIAYGIWFALAFCLLITGFAIGVVVSITLIAVLPFLWGAMVRELDAGLTWVGATQQHVDLILGLYYMFRCRFIFGCTSA
jgi:hypothetical protein